MDLKRLQILAEAVGKKIGRGGIIAGVEHYYLSDAKTDIADMYAPLTDIRARLEAEYRKRAEQELSIARILNAVDKTDVYGEKEGYWYQRLTRIADELAAMKDEPKEPTMVEPTQVELSVEFLRAILRSKNVPQEHFHYATVLLDLYERKEK